MSENIQTTTIGQTPPCLQQKSEKTRYLSEVHFSDTSIQNVEDKLKRVIFHDLEHGKKGKIGIFDEYVLDKQQQVILNYIFGSENHYNDENLEELKSIMYIADHDSGCPYGKTGSGTDGNAWFYGRKG